MADAIDATRGWGTETFTLKRAFTLGGVEIKAITLRVPTGADIEAYIKAPERTLRKLLDTLADTEPRVLDAMHGSDYSRLLASVGEFVAGVR